MRNPSSAVSPGASGSSSPIAGVPSLGWSPSRPQLRPTGTTIPSWALPAEPSLAQRVKPGIRTLTAFFMAAADVLMDSAGFLALWDARDEHHPFAVRLQAELARKRRRFMTTDY